MGGDGAAAPAAEVVLWALDALEAAMLGCDQGEAAQNARSMLAGLDAVASQRAAGWLASVAARALSMRRQEPAAVQRWLDRVRCEALAQLADFEEQRS